MRHWMTSSLVVAVASVATVLAQTPPETILTIEANKTVWYMDDVGDPTRNATSATMPTGSPISNFYPLVVLADVVAVNGKPAKGTIVGRGVAAYLRPAPTGGEAITDIRRNNVVDFHAEIQQVDGTPVGSLVLCGLGSGLPPVGAPAGAMMGNFAVLGGTGAFAGARGQAASGSTVLRVTSITENPLYRRDLTADGIWKLVVHLIPMTRPELLASPVGPAIYHASDWTQVTQEKPARAGEWLIMAVSGLGPTKPSLDPGTTFPPYLQAVHMVNSPVEVTVGGRATETHNSIGWPTLTNVYRTDFLVPADVTPGLASVAISAAWIKGAEVQIPVR